MFCMVELASTLAAAGAEASSLAPTFASAVDLALCPAWAAASTPVSAFALAACPISAPLIFTFCMVQLASAGADSSSRSEEHTYELKSLIRISLSVFFLQIQIHFSVFHS